MNHEVQEFPLKKVSSKKHWTKNNWNAIPWPGNLKHGHGESPAGHFLSNFMWIKTILRQNVQLGVEIVTAADWIILDSFLVFYLF